MSTSFEQRAVKRCDCQRKSNDDRRRSDGMQMSDSAAIMVLRSLVRRSRFLVAATHLTVLRAAAIWAGRRRYRSGEAGMRD